MSRIVVDLGCYAHGKHNSIDSLIAKYEPDVLFGYDPHPDVKEGVFDVFGTTVIIANAAAWTDDFGVCLQVDGVCTAIIADGEPVASFDFSAWLATLPREADIIVKMDIEGAEYRLLPALHDSGMDKRLSLVVLETHSDEEFLGRVPGVTPVPIEVACEVSKWWM